MSDFYDDIFRKEQARIDAQRAAENQQVRVEEAQRVRQRQAAEYVGAYLFDTVLDVGSWALHQYRDAGVKAIRVPRWGRVWPLYTYSSAHAATSNPEDGSTYISYEGLFMNARGSIAHAGNSRFTSGWEIRDDISRENATALYVISTGIDYGKNSAYPPTAGERDALGKYEEYLSEAAYQPRQIRRLGEDVVKNVAKYVALAIDAYNHP